ncbi:MAG TPA: hypothetical protein VHN15_05975 [Thermoanaerobaculia bacterium]|nr:hypothetical protein [Thermoanaerobaculia bacterium]
MNPALSRPLASPALPASSRRRAVSRAPLHTTMAVTAALLSWALVGDWLAPVAVLLLWAIWYLLRSDEGPPVLALALTFQWTQVTSGVFYHGITGRDLDTILLSDYRPMVLIGMGCVASLTAGLAVALRWRRSRPARFALPQHAFGTQGLYSLYLVLLVSMGFVQTLAWQLPMLTQGILALGFLRLVAFYLLLRRLTAPSIRWRPVLLLLAVEVLLGFTGFFASFREPLMLLTLVFLERFNARRLRHWLLVGASSALIFFFALLWLSIRTTYRSSFQMEAFAQSRTARLEKVATLSRGWLGSDFDQMMENVDFFVDRLWTVYYPALAVSRVPEVLPHTGGEILKGAVRHILMPRLFFPNKPGVTSDSEMVRKYSGVWVAGAEQGTSIAFGYAAESYLDFGLPWMFAPVLVLGFVMGRLYLFLLWRVWHRELAVGLVTVVFWLALYLFERSWIQTLGFSFTLMIYMGVSVWALDRYLMSRRARRKRLLGLNEVKPSSPAVPA